MGRIIVVGAGIIGLWTTLLLTEAGLARDITVVARHHPGDLAIEYTSPIAGAHFSCGFGGDEPNITRFCRLSYPMLKRLFDKFSGQLAEAGLERLPQIEYFDTPIDEKILEGYRAYLDDFQVITDAADLTAHGATFGIKYQTFNFYSPKLLLFLKRYLQSQGVTFLRAHLERITDAPKVTGVTVPAAVFNCTGVMAPELGGVVDSVANYPIRGQVVSVRAPWIRENVSIRKKGHPPTYIIPRPHSNGRVILGGYFDTYDYTSGTSAEQTQSILARTTALHPELLKHGPLEVLDERAGLRPGREGGPRIEREYIDGLPVIHNYGAGGIGYQCGLAMSQDAVDLYFGQKSKL